MELSKVKPSKIYDKNEVTFKNLLKQILKTKFNGFIRITTNSNNEGFILFKEGEGIAASYSRYLKNFVLDEELFKEDALRKIEHIASHRPYIIEVYELNISQIDYAIEFNEKYVLENDYLSRYLKKPKKTIKKEKIQGKVLYKKNGDPEDLNHRNVNDKSSDKKGDAHYTNNLEKLNFVTNHPNEKTNHPIDQIIGEFPLKHNQQPANIRELFLNNNASGKIENFNEHNQNPEPLTIEKPQITPLSHTKNIKTLIAAIKGKQKTHQEKKPAKTYNDHRSMEELKLLLNSLNNHEIEMIELNIMNNIKKAILYIPKVKEKSVNISIDRKNGLMGCVNIEAEYTDKGFLDLITGSFKDDLNYLEDRIYESTQLEIKNVFGNFHEVLDYFDISIKVV